MIRSLREEVRHSLRSGVSITSVGQCVEELVLNSTDAQATCIAARVDLETFRIQVVDNGRGLCQEDMEKVGMRYFTSKCHSLKDLENLKFNGFRGEAISSMADVSSIVDISSKFKNTARTFSKLFQNGKPLQVKETEENRPSAGTTVTVYNLFYNLPVRRKHMDHVLEFEKIRQRLESVSLLNPSISFSLKNDAGQSVVLQLPKTKDTRSRFCQIYGLDRSQKLREIQHSLKGFSMSGFISIEGHYNKSMQYLYVNNRLVLKTKLHKFIDFILRKESVVCRPKNMQKVHSSPGRHRSCSELHGIFIINIHCHYSEYDVCLEPAKTLIEFQDWDSVLQCIEDGVKTFLKRENLFLEQPAEGVDELRDMNYSGPSTKSNLHHVEKQDSAGITSACDSVMESYDMSNLTSKTVCRSKILNGNMSQVCEIHDDDRNKIQEPLGTQNTLNVEPGEFSVRDMTERADPRMFSEKLHPTASICFDKGSSYTFDNTDNKSNSNVCSESSQCPPKAVMHKEVVCELLERENGVQNKQVAECSVIEPFIQCEHSLISDNFNKDEKDGGALYYSLGREDSYKPPIPTPSINQDSLAVAQSDNKGLSVSGTNSSIETAALNLVL
ncbi:DNA mismatch repair protein Mlh3-like [Rhinophrynus dorsalis]